MNRLSLTAKVIVGWRIELKLQRVCWRGPLRNPPIRFQSIRKHSTFDLARYDFYHILSISLDHSTCALNENAIRFDITEIKKKPPPHRTWLWALRLHVQYSTGLLQNTRGKLVSNERLA